MDTWLFGAEQPAWRELRGIYILRLEYAMSSNRHQKSFVRAMHTAVALGLMFVLTSQAHAITYTWESHDLDFNGSSSSALALHNGNLYVAGGSVDRTESFQSNIWQIDLSDFSAQSVAHLPYGFWANDGTPSAVTGDYMVMSPQIGPSGNNGWGTHNQVIEYNLATPSVNAVQTSQLRSGNIWTPSVIADPDETAVYMFGGWTGSGVNTIWKYYPENNQLDTVSEMLGWTGSVHTATALSNGQVVLFGGNQARSRVEIFDTATNTMVYRNGDALPGAGTTSAYTSWTATVNGNEHTFVGNSDELYEFDPTTKTFSTSEFAMIEGTGRTPAVDQTTGKVYFVQSVDGEQDRLVIGTPHAPKPRGPQLFSTLICSEDSESPAGTTVRARVGSWELNLVPMDDALMAVPMENRTLTVGIDYNVPDANARDRVAVKVKAYESGIDPIKAGDTYVFHYNGHGYDSSDFGVGSGLSLTGGTSSVDPGILEDWRLADWFRDTDAGVWKEVNKIFFLDTCHAGAMVDDNFDLAATMEGLGLSNTVVFASSMAEQVSYARGGKGLFTEAVIRALAVNEGVFTNDENGDGMLSLEEIYVAISREYGMLLVPRHA